MGRGGGGWGGGGGGGVDRGIQGKSAANLTRQGGSLRPQPEELAKCEPSRVARGLARSFAADHDFPDAGRRIHYGRDRTLDLVQAEPRGRGPTSPAHLRVSTLYDVERRNVAPRGFR